LALAYVWRASVHLSAADAVAALTDYRKALAIAKRLASLDPGNTNWGETTAAVHAKLGDFFRKQSQADAAAENYRESVTIAQKLAAADPQNSEPRYLLADAYFGLGELSSAQASGSRSSPERAASLREARSWYQKSSDEWRQISRPLPVPSDGFAWGNSRETARALTRCDALLANVQSRSAGKHVH